MRHRSRISVKVILAIDGGGSRTRCLAIDQRGHVISQAETGPSNHLLVEAEIVARSLADAIDQTLSLGRLSHEDVACVSAGLAGVDFDGTGASGMGGLFNWLGCAKPVINCDNCYNSAGDF